MGAEIAVEGGRATAATVQGEHAAFERSRTTVDRVKHDALLCCLSYSVYSVPVLLSPVKSNLIVLVDQLEGLKFVLCLTLKQLS